MIKFSKLYDVKSPEQGTAHSAGIDFFIPFYTREFAQELEERNKYCIVSTSHILIRPNTRILIPSGLKVWFPNDKVLIAFNKSGIAQKRGLIVGPCVVDADYREQVYFGLINTTSEAIRLEYGAKIIQFLLLDINYPELEEVDLSNLYKDLEESSRKGGFGSTGV